MRGERGVVVWMDGLRLWRERTSCNVNCVSSHHPGVACVMRYGGRALTITEQSEGGSRPRRREKEDGVAIDCEGSLVKVS